MFGVRVAKQCAENFDLQSFFFRVYAKMQKKKFVRKNVGHLKKLLLAFNFHDFVLSFLPAKQIPFVNIKSLEL